MAALKCPHLAGHHWRSNWDGSA